MARLVVCAVVALVVAPFAGCSKPPIPLTRSLLDRSLELGTGYLLANQRPYGNFNYEYDWKAKKLSPGDSQVRQAGAMWGLALIHHARREEGKPSADVAAALDRAIDFFARHGRRTADGRRFVIYPGERAGATGLIALAALSLVDYLRSAPDMPEPRRAELRALLDGYLAQLAAARRPDGAWHSAYEFTDGMPSGPNNPYADGEALLVYVKAAKYLERDDLRAPALASAEAGWKGHVVGARAKDSDSAATKGFYQWGSMSFYELATSGWPETAHWGGRVIELADWMVDVHDVLDKGRNTAYAFEGLVPAWRLARDAGDQAHVDKFGRVIELGLVKLLSWQVGGPLANSFIGKAPDDALAIGGVQNHEEEPLLRIDVTQHQMHAVILARRHFRP